MDKKNIYLIEKFSYKSKYISDISGLNNFREMGRNTMKSIVWTLSFICTYLHTDIIVKHQKWTLVTKYQHTGIHNIHLYICIYSKNIKNDFRKPQNAMMYQNLHSRVFIKIIIILSLTICVRKNIYLELKQKITYTVVNLTQLSIQILF